MPPKVTWAPAQPSWSSQVPRTQRSPAPGTAPALSPPGQGLCSFVLILCEQHKKATVQPATTEIRGGSAPVRGKWLLAREVCGVRTPAPAAPPGWAGSLPPTAPLLGTNLGSWEAPRALQQEQTAASACSQPDTDPNFTPSGTPTKQQAPNPSVLPTPAVLPRGEPHREGLNIHRRAAAAASCSTRGTAQLSNNPAQGGNREAASALLGGT